MTTEFSFHVSGRDGAARTGEIRMPRGVIRTPAFMPVGTAATVKGMYPEQVRALGADVVLGNTYHLMLRPGAERIARLGGLHKFMNWPHPILTDSGGFQVMSLAQSAQADGGGRHLPVAYRRLQAHAVARALGRNPEPARLRHRHAARRMRLAALRGQGRGEGDAAVAALGGALQDGLRQSAPGRALFGIVQGGAVPALRDRERPKELVAMDLKGYAIGGLGGRRAAGGHAGDDRRRSSRICPPDRPRYLMGVGTPDDLVEAVMPRHRHVRLRDADAGRPPWPDLYAFRADEPEECQACRRSATDRRDLVLCQAANGYARAYLHHLVKAEEMLGKMLLTWVNLVLLSGADGRSARGRSRPGRLSRFHRRDQGRLGAKASRLERPLAS